MKTHTAKPRMTLVTDPQEIASIKRGGRLEINGFEAGMGQYFGYVWSVQRYRARQKRLAHSAGEQKLAGIPVAVDPALKPDEWELHSTVGKGQK